MKTMKALLLTTCLVASFCSQVSAQSLDSFLKYEGVKTLAELAHPTSTMDKGYYKVYSDAVDVEVYYTDGVYTKIRLYYSNGWFTKVQVITDTDWLRPFVGVEFIKNLLFELSREYDKSSSIKSSYEQYLNKTIENFSGKDITMLAMTLSWVAY
ncbi:MAG: hypothetical protein ACI8P3_002863 [Saprospiraceae bacterium]|jgi:hypothetical protein